MEKNEIKVFYGIFFFNLIPLGSFLSDFYIHSVTFILMGIESFDYSHIKYGILLPPINP